MVLDLEQLELKSGSHSKRDQGVCLMEAVAWFNNEAHSDHPQCACPVLTKFGIGLNDRFDAKYRQKLKPFIPRLVGTRNPALVRRRAEFLTDRALRLFVPIALRHAGDALERAKLIDHAAKLRLHAKTMEELPEYTVGSSAAAARWAADADAAAADADAAARWAAAAAAAADAAADAAAAARWAAAAADAAAAAADAAADAAAAADDDAAAAADAAARWKVWDLAIEVFDQAIRIGEEVSVAD